MGVVVNITLVTLTFPGTFFKEPILWLVDLEAQALLIKWEIKHMSTRLIDKHDYHQCQIQPIGWCMNEWMNEQMDTTEN